RADRNASHGAADQTSSVIYETAQPVMGMSSKCFRKRRSRRSSSVDRHRRFLSDLSESRHLSSQGVTVFAAHEVSGSQTAEEHQREQDAEIDETHRSR